MNSSTLTRELVSRLQGKPELQQRITAHIREKTGHVTIPSFVNNGATETTKMQILGECVSAVLAFNKGKADWDAKLLGSIPNGQAGAPERDEPTPEVEPTAETKKEPDPQPMPPRKQQSQPVEKQAPVVDKLREALLSVIGEVRGKSEGVDADAVKAIVEEVFETKADTMVETFTKLFKGEVQAHIDGLTLPPRNAIEIKTVDSVKEITGATHWQLPQVITWVSANVPVWLWSAAGSGKTHLGRQIGTALSMDVSIISVDPTMTVGKLVGYRNLSTGDFIEGFLYKPFKNGGLVMLDEIDTGDPGIIACLNALLANGHYLFPNGETVERHEKFRVIAGANSKGMGATAGYVARNRLDAATLDRFAVIELEYDTALEMAVATGQPITGRKDWNASTDKIDTSRLEQWVRWVQKVRAAVGTSVLVSPRASILGCRALQAGINPEEAANALVFKTCTKDTIDSIIRTCGRPL